MQRAKQTLLSCTLCPWLTLLIDSVINMLPLFLIESVLAVLAHTDIVICSSKKQQCTKDHLCVCCWEKHLIWGRTYFSIFHSLRIEFFKFNNFDRITSLGVQINGLKEVHFSESAENVKSGNRGFFFKGTANGLQKLWQVELLFTSLFKKKIQFFGQQPLSGA